MRLKEEVMSIDRRLKNLQRYAPKSDNLEALKSHNSAVSTLTRRMDRVKSAYHTVRHAQQDQARTDQNKLPPNKKRPRPTPLGVHTPHERRKNKNARRKGKFWSRTEEKSSQCKWRSHKRWKRRNNRT